MKKLIFIMFLGLLLVGCQSNNICRSEGTYKSDGIYYSDGTCYSNGTYNSDGTYDSDGTCYSDGTYRSYGTYDSDGTYRSDGTYDSDGTYRSDGTFYSDGTYNSYFTVSCKGLYKCMFCYKLKGGCYMIFNQKITEQQFKKFIDDIGNILSGWLPYIVNFQYLKNNNWCKEEFANGEILIKLISNDTGIDLYYKAWQTLPCNKKNKLINYIKSIDYLDKEETLEIFQLVTGFNISDSDCNYVEIEGKRFSKDTVREALREYVK